MHVSIEISWPILLTLPLWIKSIEWTWSPTETKPCLVRTLGFQQSCKRCWFPTLSCAKTLSPPESQFRSYLSIRQDFLLWSSELGFWKSVNFLNWEWMSMFLEKGCIAFNRSLKIAMTPKTSATGMIFSPHWMPSPLLCSPVSLAHYLSANGQWLLYLKSLYTLSPVPRILPTSTARFSY